MGRVIGIIVSVMVAFTAIVMVVPLVFMLSYFAVFGDFVGWDMLRRVAAGWGTFVAMCGLFGAVMSAGV